MSDKETILAANAAFYGAFASGAIEELVELWAAEDDISCIHPGWPALIGRNAVIGSWRGILASPERPVVICQQPYAIVAGDHGRVLCVELVGPVALAACNHFARIHGAWRLVHHQSSPIAALVGEAPDDAPPSRQVH